jgi:hypothetical protein
MRTVVVVALVVVLVGQVVLPVEPVVAVALVVVLVCPQVV